MSLVVLHGSWMFWECVGYFCGLWRGAEVGINVEGKSRVSKQEEAYLDWEDSSSTNDNDDDDIDDDSGNPMSYHVLKAYCVPDTSHTF